MKKQLKTFSILILSLMLGLSALTTGCSNSQAETPEDTLAPDAKTGENEPETVENATKVLLAVSFGTSYNETRAKTIDAIENALAQANPDYELRRAFTSQIIINKLAERDGLQIDSVTEAMERLVADGIKEVLVQPTHVMSGYEYDDVVNEVMPYSDKFESLKIGNPLLISDSDYQEVASILKEENQSYEADDTAIVFMGHGTEHEANATYAKLQSVMIEKGYSNYIIGTVEAEPTLEDVIAQVKATDAKKVVLLPLMIVAGDHATNDMAGDDEDSWKTAFIAEGYEVECVLKGLGEYEGIRKLFIKHAEEAK